MSPDETIGVRLRRLREEKRLTQQEIAAPGVSAQYISKLERGQRTASVKALRKLAANLGVTAQFLETGHELADDAEKRAFWLDDAELALRIGEDPNAAEETLRRVLGEAAAAGDRRSETRARLGLGTLAAHRGEYEMAIAILEPVLLEPWVTPLTHPDTFFTLGHAYVAVGRGEEALSLFRGCLDDIAARRPFNPAAAARFGTYLSYVLDDLGRLDEAREAIETALRHSRASDDPYTSVRLHWSNARLSASAGEFELAKASVNRAIGLLESTEDMAHLARAHMLAADIALWADEHDVASEHLEEAKRLMPEGSNVEDRACLLIHEAVIAARSGGVPDALDLANNALQLLAGHHDSSISGRAHWALGEAYAAAGATSSARAAFIQASELIPPASKHSTRLLEAWQRAVPAESS